MPLNNLGAGLNKAAKTGSGASTFLQLSDTPSSYSGEAGKYLRINGGETGVETVTLSGGGDLLAANNLSDLADAGTARTNLGVDAAGTDNSTDVTLAGTPNYITIAGQVITRALVNLASHITGTLGIANGGTGATTAGGARTNLGLGTMAVETAADYVTADGTTPLTADWDVGANTVTALRFVSDQATGTAPFSVSSTTLVANLNADLFEGQEGSFYRDADNLNAGTVDPARVHVVTRRHQINYLVTGDDIATGEPFVAYVRVPWKCTIKNIGHQVDAATSVTWNLEERATRGSAGTDVFSSDEVSTTTYQEETTFSNAGLAADDWLVLSISAISGTPTQLLIEVEVEVDTDAS